jgi:hypothetical protein
VVELGPCCRSWPFRVTGQVPAARWCIKAATDPSNEEGEERYGNPFLFHTKLVTAKIDDVKPRRRTTRQIEQYNRGLCVFSIPNNRYFVLPKELPVFHLWGKEKGAWMTARGRVFPHKT